MQREYHIREHVVWQIGEHVRNLTLLRPETLPKNSRTESDEFTLLSLRYFPVYRQSCISFSPVA
jgi:hypothetical protein